MVQKVYKFCFRSICRRVSQHRNSVNDHCDHGKEMVICFTMIQTKR